MTRGSPASSSRSSRRRRRTTTGRMSGASSPMTYSPGAVAGEAALRARFDEEARRRVPTRPWADLPATVRDAPLGGVDGEATGDAVSASGLVVDGVLHIRGCPTRYGPFPYCREMRHGVFSVTKSLGGAVALLRLAQKYGDAVFDAKIEDYVTVTASHDGWKDVTFADVLGMATGIGEALAAPRAERPVRRREQAAVLPRPRAAQPGREARRHLRVPGLPLAARRSLSLQLDAALRARRGDGRVPQAARGSERRPLGHARAGGARADRRLPRPDPADDRA